MTLPPQTIQFLIAIGFGVALGASTQGLGASVAWVIVGAFVLSVITCMLEGRRLPRSMQSPYGVTFPRGCSPTCSSRPSRPSPSPRFSSAY